MYSIVGIVGFGVVSDGGVVFGVRRVIYDFVFEVLFFV